MTASLDLLRGPIIAILNTGSGSCNADSHAQAEAAFAAAGLNDVEVVTVDPPLV